MAGKGNRQRLKTPNAVFGFAFVLQANGGGGPGTPFPKTYSIIDPTNFNLKGFVDETNNNAPVVAWPTFPGFNPNPTIGPFSRVYHSNITPNNVLLSQVSKASLVSTYGMRSKPQESFLPQEFDYGRSPLFVNQDEVINNFTGIRRIAITLLSPTAASGTVAQVLVNVTQMITPLHPRIELDINNLGEVSVVNLSADVVTIGVDCELWY